jgi:hypothetical protein
MNDEATSLDSASEHHEDRITTGAHSNVRANKLKFFTNTQTLEF